MQAQPALVGVQLHTVFRVAHRPDVRIKDHGLETIEVVDNGAGIDKADWPSIGEHTRRFYPS